MKKPAKKPGSGSQKPGQKAPGEQKADGSKDTDEEEEEEEESDDSDDSETDDDESGGEDKGVKKDKKANGDLDISELPENVQKHIKDLRRESAKYRTKAKNLETSHSQLSERIKGLAGGTDGDDTPPEERVGQLDAANNSLALDNAILQTAVDHGITKDGLKYFKFLVASRIEELGEGEELSEDDLEEIADEARAKSGSGKQRTKTSVTDGDKGGKAPGGKSGVTVEQFAKMGVIAKTELRQKNPDLYAALFEEAKEKRLLFR